MNISSLRLFAAFILVLLLAGCGHDQISKNMEQIYAEEGVPVAVERIEPGGFTSEKTYNAVLTGLRESSAYAMVDDQIDRIDFSVGDFVDKDAVVLTFPTDNPSAKYFQAKVTHENAQATFERMKSYYEVGGLSRQDFENAEAAYKVARADWNSVKQSVLVIAPISGVLTRINVRESENVRAEDELFTVSQVDKFKARIWVSDKEILDFQKGQTAFATWNALILEGRVVQVDLSMNQTRQAFGVVVEFDNPDMDVRCGVTAKVSINTYEDPHAIATERKNVFKDGNSHYIFVVENGTAQKRTVELGKLGELSVEILSGLNAGEALITEGQMHIDDGTKVRLVGSEVQASSN